MSTDLQLRDQVIQKSWEDAIFREKLLSDPKSAIQETFGIQVPDNVELTAMEESPDRMFLIIPPNPSASKKDEKQFALW